MSIIPGKLKGQPHQLSFKFIRSANRLPMHPSSTLRPVVEHRGVEPLFHNEHGREESHAHRGTVVTVLAHRARQDSALRSSLPVR